MPKRKSASLDTPKLRVETIDLPKEANDLPWSIFLERHIPFPLKYSPSQLDHNRSSSKPQDSDPRARRNSVSINIKHTQNPETSKDSEPSKYTTIKDSELEECFRLIEHTSGDSYRSSGFGWHPRRKKREMREKDMKYLLVHDEGPPPDQKRDSKNSSPQTSTLQGFLSFMLTYEDGQPVIYIYEVHLVDAAQGCGLGRHMINLVEKIGKSTAMQKSMLTVFRSNHKAVRWYEGLGYEIDQYSPADKKLRAGKVKQADYLILSKKLL